jgi:putative endonuclease
MQTGADGETLAAEYLIGKGYEIVCRNYRYCRAEIDLIVRKGNWLVFVEVKTRSGVLFGYPEEFVDRAKEENVLLAAEEFMWEMKWEGNVRYDIVAVVIGGGKREVVHVEDAFY